MVGQVFLAAIFATPLFGLLVDRFGHRSLAMAAGSLLLLAVFPTLLYTMLWMFTILSLGGLVFSALLRQRETGPHGHGLETIRAKGL